jgi:hypothetical protein
MAQLRIEAIWRIGGWLSLAFVAGLIIVLVMSSSMDAAAIIAFPFVIAWIAAPVVAAAGFVGASSTRAGAIAFLVAEVSLVVSTAWLMVDVYLHGNSTAGLAFIPWPFI